MEKMFVGIDISKSKLDVFIRPTGETLLVKNDQSEVDQLAEKLIALHPEKIVLEATGGYESLVFAALAAAKLPVVRVNAKFARDFAKAIGQLAKTDKVDAKILAHYAEVINPELRPIPDSAQDELAALITRRRQISAMITMESNRLQCVPLRIKEKIQLHLNYLRAQLDEIEGETDTFIRQQPAWEEKRNLLTGMKGVGPTVSADLIGLLPELGTLSNKKITALVGLAPFKNESGKARRKQVIKGGRGMVRSILYMASLSASQHNPAIKTFYQRLVAAGKSKKIALTACMRKVLIILNSMVKNKTEWRTA
ncbi:MAG: IS110 family transposase [Deltaproteobacteria bacterium]|nr:IS110 family transposase [Deltaproteobacteria bacterium]